jgi:pimeloyl-ACP methyl ester carboxylesterase
VPYAELDRVRLYYERAGTGAPELLFVPGWCCDHTAFQPQFDHFAAGHAVTALDLRGVGQSDVPEDGYGIRDFADDVAQLCGVVGIEKPVVVGHSLGGMVGIELAARYPLLPRALVLVDPGPIDPLAASVKFFQAAPEYLAGPSGEEVRRMWVEDMGARDEELAGWIAGHMSAVPLPVAARSRSAPCRRCCSARGSTRNPTRCGCARSSPTWRSASPSVPATSTSSRCPSR